MTVQLTALTIWTRLAHGHLAMTKATTPTAMAVVSMTRHSLAGAS